MLNELTTIVTPAALMGWHRRLIARKYDGNKQRGKHYAVNRGSSPVTEALLRSGACRKAAGSRSLSNVQRGGASTSARPSSTRASVECPSVIHRFPEKERAGAC